MYSTNKIELRNSTKGLNRWFIKGWRSSCPLMIPTLWKLTSRTPFSLRLRQPKLSQKLIFRLILNSNSNKLPYLPLARAAHQCHHIARQRPPDPNWVEHAYRKPLKKEKSSPVREAYMIYRVTLTSSLPNWDAPMINVLINKLRIADWKTRYKFSNFNLKTWESTIIGNNCKHSSRSSRRIELRDQEQPTTLCRRWPQVHIVVGSKRLPLVLVRVL